MSKQKQTRRSRGFRNSGAPSHKGWLVRGIPPGTSEAERSDAIGTTRKDKRIVVGTFSSPSTAEECRSLAARYGWLELEIIEAKSEGSPEDGLWREAVDE